MSDTSDKPKRFSKFFKFSERVVSDHDGTPSSARIWGGFIIAAVNCGVLYLTWSISKKIDSTTDAAVLVQCAAMIKVVALLYLLQTLTALSLYGINAWKYISTLPFMNKTSGMASSLVNDMTEEEPKKPVQPTREVPKMMSVTAPEEEEGTPISGKD